MRGLAKPQGLLFDFCDAEESDGGESIDRDQVTKSLARGREFGTDWCPNAAGAAIGDIDPITKTGLRAPG